jgi:hypothetical protein
MCSTPQLPVSSPVSVCPAVYSRTDITCPGQLCRVTRCCSLCPGRSGQVSKHSLGVRVCVSVCMFVCLWEKRGRVCVYYCVYVRVYARVCTRAFTHGLMIQRMQSTIVTFTSLTSLPLTSAILVGFQLYHWIM